MPSRQDQLNAYIAGPTFTPAVPPCPGIRRFLFHTVDPIRIKSLETRGDARIGADVTYIQLEHFPNIPLKIHARLKALLVSNCTFQQLVIRFGADSGNAAEFSKMVANSWEIYVEAYARLMGAEAAARWNERLFVPMIKLLLSETMEPRKRACLKSIRTAAPLNPRAALKAKNNKVDRQRARLSRRGQENRAPATSSGSKTDASTLPSRPFTFGA
ncbi:hypothetical protein C8R46DRAFT_1120249 [Mycena filopes]|nr:hypothetical protein C8R46DRAFT_1120249 [Mycena filopes]